MKQPTQSKKLSFLKQAVFFGIYSALIIVLKEIMSGLPNIEPVTVLLIPLTLTFGIKALLPTYVFVVIEIVFYGINLWNISYLYVWALLVLIVMLLSPIHRFIDKKCGKKAPLWQTVLWTAVAALYGIAFGTLCSVPSFFTLGVGGAISWIISGIPFDISHCIGNAVLTAFAFYPVYKVLMWAKKQL